EYFYQAEGAPIFGMFIQSGGGDSSPAGDRLGHPGPARIELLGTDAAPRLYALYQDLEWRDEAAIEVRSRRVDLNYAALGYEDSEEFKSGSGLPYIWGAWQCNVGQGDDANPATSSEGKPKSCADVKQLLETLDEPIPHPEMHQTLLTAAMFGEVALITLPGEPTYSVIKYLRDQVATREVDGAPVEVLAFGYSQDHLLYLTHPDDWFQGGYESEMSLWGPFAAKFFVDRQMATLDTILAGEDGPVFAEESPPLGSPGTFTPRGYERSTNPGDVIAEAPGKLERGQTARFSWGGGDPSLGSPYVVVEVDQGNGEFAPQPSPSGWPGTYLDNTRYHMITRVAPDPAPNGKVLDERAHVWMVDWQIPLDFPAGYARLRATGSYWDGAAPASYEVVSAPIYVRGVDGGALEATPAGDELELRLTAPGVPFVGDDKYPEGGFRLLDPTVGPSDTLTTRAPLRVWFTQDGEAVGQELTVSFDAARGAHVLTLADAGVPDGALTVHAHLEADIEPHVYTAPVN
ncbi:MAG: hypothetical protein KC636_25730, partial [Myxococcales bacterium]|nr:hypothetical protein [Myxococcales bacterium]